MNYVEEVLAAIQAHEPVSPWGLHWYCSSWKTKEGPENLRVALRSVMQVGWVQTNGDGLLFTSNILAALATEGPPSVQGEGDLATSISLPTRGQVIPLPRQLSPTAPSTSENHLAGERGSRTRALYCAIQNGAASLSCLEDELGKFLEDDSCPGGDTVRRAATALLHKASSARREFGESQKWIQETLLPDISE